MMDLEALFRRIGYQGSRAATAENLAALHRAFAYAVPFENLDIYLGRPIALDVAGFFEKVVRRGRGGFCYELNGLFGAVLSQLGFDVTLVSARVHSADGSFGREFGHLCLLVDVAGERWLADVGFGDWPTEPLRFDRSDLQLADGFRYHVVGAGAGAEDRRVLERDHGDGWRPRYSVSPTWRALEEFAEICHDLQTDPNSWFRRCRFATRATTTGRVTLRDSTLTVAAGTSRIETILSDEAAVRTALLDYFGIDLEPSG